jgi:putative transposase
MLVRQGFQYALRLKSKREAVLRQWAGCRRFVFNEALAHQLSEMAAGRGRPGYATLCARLPTLKQQHQWLGEPPAQALQQALKDLCRAWDAKFTARFGAPRFKKRGESDTLRLPQGCRYDATEGVLYVPKLGALRLRHSREALGRLKNVTLRQERGRWIASLQTERELEPDLPTATSAVGLDFGVATTIMPSNGAPIELPARIGRYERRMKRLQRNLCRKKKGSRNRAKARAKLNACHGRVASIRRDFLHQVTTNLVAGHALIAIEDLAVKNMTASAAGTVDEPGKNVKAKSGLNRVILRNGWSMARRNLEYKAAWSGVVLIAVPPAHTSLQCSACRFIDPLNRQTQSRFSCMACGHSEHADRNAAKNILCKAQMQLLRNSANSVSELGGCPASTAGPAGINACAGEGRRPQLPRPRSAARDGLGLSLAEPSLAGTTSELSLSEDRSVLRGGQYAEDSNPLSGRSVMANPGKARFHH